MTGWLSVLRDRREVLRRVLRDRRDVLLDALLWAALSAPIAWALVSPPHRQFYGWRLAGSLALMAVAVLASRRQPLVSLVLVVVPTAVDGNFAFAIPVMSYLVGLRMVRGRPAALAFAGIALSGTAVNLGLLDTGMQTWFLTATTLLFAGVFPWLVGRYRRQHRELVLAGWEQADLLEREQRGAADRARMRERARIAQDMHDSLGHELSLLALRAGALEVAPDLDDPHRRAAGELRASVAAATDRLREIIGVLREDAEPPPTRPASASVVELVEGARQAGMSVQLIGDDPAEANPVRPEELPPMPARAMHRVVQEALTNAARYAPGASVTVRLARAGTRIEVSVVNEPPPAGPLSLAGALPSAGPLSLAGPLPSAGPLSLAGALPSAGALAAAPSTGSGLLALAERVRLAGGALRAGPRGGGFAVVARLPRIAGAAGPAGHADAADAGLVGDADVAGAGAVDGGAADGGAFDGGAVDGLQRSRSAYRLRHARRRVRRSLLVAVAAPAAIAVALCLVYYPIATFDSVLDRTAFDRMRIGQPREELGDLLPHRPVAPSDDRLPRPPGSACEYYTDGNFPLAQPAYRLCFAGGRLVAKDRLIG
jgi:signal transduction histidine kinase